MSKDLFAPPTPEELNSFENDQMFAPPSDAELSGMGDYGQLESLGRGAVSGASFGFYDEAKGAGASALQSLVETSGVKEDNKNDFETQYREERDAVRAADKAAQEQNPWSYGIGDFAGSVGTGLLAGGAGAAAKVGSALGKTGLQTAVKGGGKEALKALMKIGAIEGAAMGLGRSEADLTEGEVLDAAKDTALGGAIGYVAPAAISKGLQGAKSVAKGADSLAEATPIVGDVYKHLKDVGKEGAENLGTSFKGAAQNALKKLSGSADELQEKALGQETKYGDDLLEAQKVKAVDIDSKAVGFKEDLYKTMNQVGDDLNKKDLAIEEFISTNPEAMLRYNDKGMRISKFNFDPLDDEFKLIQSKLDKDIPMLNVIQNDIKSGNYITVTQSLRDLNRLMDGASPNNVHHLKQLKGKIQNIVDDELRNLPGAGSNLYAERMGIAKKYGELADVRDKLGAGVWRDDSSLSEATKLMSNETESAGIPFKRTLDNVKTAGDQNLNISAQNLLESGAEHNRFKIHPKMGEMFNDLGEKQAGPLLPEAQNEKLATQFKEVFGAPKEFGMASGFAKAVEGLSEGTQGLSSTNKQQQLVEWLRQTYPDQADKIIKELEQQSHKLNTLQAGLEKNTYAGQDVSSTIRFLKKMSDPGAFALGKGMEKMSRAGVPQQATAATQRVLTHPAGYKTAVQAFKDSQKNEEPLPE